MSPIPEECGPLVLIKKNMLFMNCKTYILNIKPCQCRNSECYPRGVMVTAIDLAPKNISIVSMLLTDSFSS